MELKFIATMVIKCPQWWAHLLRTESSRPADLSAMDWEHTLQVR